jgi:hypothetical protein
MITAMTDLNAQIINEIILQARESFALAKHNYRLALAATSASILVSLIGIGVFASGRATQGAIATATGALPLVLCAQHLKSAGDQLAAASRQLNETLDNLET